MGHTLFLMDPETDVKDFPQYEPPSDVQAKVGQKRGAPPAKGGASKKKK